MDSSSNNEAKDTSAVADQHVEPQVVASPEPWTFRKILTMVLITLLLIVLLMVFALIGCIRHYRQQMTMYKIAPFTPPKFLPQSWFPRPDQGYSFYSSI